MNTTTTTTNIYQLYVCVFRMTEGETNIAYELDFMPCMPPPEYEFDNYFHWFVKNVGVPATDHIDYFAHIKREYDAFIRSANIDRRRAHFTVKAAQYNYID